MAPSIFLYLQFKKETDVYDFSFIIFLGAGVESTRNVPAEVSSFTIDGLQSDSAYTLLVSSLTGSREGSPATLVIRTGNKLNLSNTHCRHCTNCL